MSDQQVSGYEALLRLDIEGPVNPELLVGTDMPMQAQLAVTEVVLDKAAAFAASLAADHRPAPVSVKDAGGPQGSGGEAGVGRIRPVPTHGYSA